MSGEETQFNPQKWKERMPIIYKKGGGEAQIQIPN